ncbi:MULTISPECIES: hypothetical protein [Rhodonellum]|nr:MULTISPECIES: hypothetical protein [Rhodonellum]SDZ13208.1 hypothetical protein SAMN05444412_106121 [Rhodonellum ikkaensis]
MEKLLLVNFEKDPDEFYMGFEPQVFDDEKNGKGHLIIGWRVDGRVDVYHQPSLTLDHAKYDIAGKGLANMVSVEMKAAEFEVDAFGVHAHYQFKDLRNRSVEFKINEYNQKKRKPFGLLAPMGNAAVHPSSMPLVLMHDFYFVRRTKTVFFIKIDKKNHQPDTFPIPMDWTRMYFARYSPEPVIATLNPAFDDVLPAIKLGNGKEQAFEGDLIYEIEWENRLPKLKSLIKNNKTHPIKLSFHPAFPNLDLLEVGSPVKGTFEISGHPSTGFVAGDYLVSPNKKGTTIVLAPSKGWKPRPTKLSLWILYSVVRIFKLWPTTYRWEASLERSKDEVWHMKSCWKRTGKIL